MRKQSEPLLVDTKRYKINKGDEKSKTVTIL